MKRCGLFFLIAALVLLCLGTMLVRSPQVRAQNDNNQGDQSNACLLTPRELSEEDFSKLVTNLDVVLRELGFKEYKIAKESEASNRSSVHRVSQSRPNS